MVNTNEYELLQSVSWWYEQLYTDMREWFSPSPISTIFGVRWVNNSDFVLMIHCDLKCNSWWRHQMETFSMLQSFDVFFYLGLNKRFSKQSRRWWFESLSRSLWRHCNVVVKYKNKPMITCIPWMIRQACKEYHLSWLQFTLVVFNGNLQILYKKKSSISYLYPESHVDHMRRNEDRI